MEHPSEQAEVVIADTFRLSGRGTVAMLVQDSRPWWPWGIHRVRVVKPDGDIFEADASVEFARVQTRKEVMVLLFRHSGTMALPPGSRVASLAVVPHAERAHVRARKRWHLWDQIGSFSSLFSGKKR